MTLTEKWQSLSNDIKMAIYMPLMITSWWLLAAGMSATCSME